MKLIKVILSFILFITCILPLKINANDLNFYVYTTISESHEKYVKEKVAYFINSQNYSFDTSKIMVGKGIDIIDKEDVNKSLFPIWYENKIIATFLVADVDGKASGVYSTNYIEQLNAIYSKTSEENPIWIIVYEEEIYGIIGNDAYNLNDNIGSSDETIDISCELNTNSTVINAKDMIDYNTIVIPRYPTTYMNSWTEYAYLTGGPNWCCHYTLYNILRNLGYTSYSLTDIKSDLDNNVGYSNLSDVTDYLTTQGFDYNSSETGYLSTSSVVNIIYNNDDYLFIVGTNQSDLSGKHAMVIVGYSIMSIETLYTVWDPHRTTSGYSTIDASTRLVTTTNSKTYKWDAGYIYNINK